MTESQGKRETDRSPHEGRTAKLFMHGRSQAVRLPKEFRFEGTEVRVSRVGGRVVLEAMKPPRFDVKAWRERMRASGAPGFLPEGRPKQPPMPSEDFALD